MQVTYIYNSGFLVELDKHILLFDYYQGTIPPLNQNKPLYVFVSHFHHLYAAPAALFLHGGHPAYPRALYRSGDLPPGGHPGEAGPVHRGGQAGGPLLYCL